MSELTDAGFLRDAAARIRMRMSRTAEDIVEIGRELIWVKERVGHGKFLPWIESEFGMSRDTAQNFMRVSERYGKNGIIPNLPPTVLYELAAPSTPEEVRTVVAEKVAAGEAVTVAEVKALKKAAPGSQPSNKKSAPSAKTPTAAVVAFTPKALQDDDDSIDEVDAVDLTDARNRAHAICGALSTIDLVEIDPQEFWAVFGSESLKVSTMKWVATALEKLIGIAEIGAAKMSQVAPPCGEEIRPTNSDEVAALANGLRTHLAGLDPIVDRIIEIEMSEFWRLLGPTACVGLAETMDGLWRLQGIANDYKKLRLPS